MRQLLKGLAGSATVDWIEKGFAEVCCNQSDRGLPLYRALDTQECRSSPIRGIGYVSILG